VGRIFMNVTVMSLDLGEGLFVWMEKGFDESKSRNSIALKRDDQDHPEEGPSEKDSGATWKLDEILGEEVHK